MKILIIDDELAALTKLKAILSVYGDCTLTTHAHQALRLFQSAIDNQHPFDLVFIDIQLAKDSGLDLLASLIEMESHAKARHAIKLMVTASGTKANLVKAYTRGCDGFLVKPVKRDILLEKLIALGVVNEQALPDQTYPPQPLSEGTPALSDAPASPESPAGPTPSDTSGKVDTP